MDSSGVLRQAPVARELDLHQYCSYKTKQLHSSTLAFLPRGTRQQCVETIVHDYRREARLASVANAGAKELKRVAPQRLHEGMKTGVPKGKLFSVPSDYSRRTSAGALDKQRKAEARALQQVESNISKRFK